jgi:hypothetical protein
LMVILAPKVLSMNALACCSALACWANGDFMSSRVPWNILRCPSGSEG